MPDIDQPGGGGVFMAIGMVVTSLSALAAGLFSWLGSRDKLQHDAEVVRLRALVETTATRVAVLEAEKDDLQPRRGHVMSNNDAPMVLVTRDPFTTVTTLLAGALNLLSVLVIVFWVLPGVNESARQSREAALESRKLSEQQRKVHDLGKKLHDAMEKAAKKIEKGGH